MTNRPDDPTAPLSERTPEQVAAYLDDHLVMALVAAEHLQVDRQGAEDYVRDRLVAVSDSWPTRVALEGEQGRRRMDRLRRVIFGSSTSTDASTDPDPADAALEVILTYGQIDGDHHKAWVIDQAVRALTGDDYGQTIHDWQGTTGAEWDTGIAP